jgi:MSHA biogenesis protein MshJ
MNAETARKTLEPALRALEPGLAYLRNLAARLDALSLRERAMIFAAGATLIFLAWQTLLMGPIVARAHAQTERLEAARRRLDDLDQLGAMTGSDALIAAAQRNRALQGRLTKLDAELRYAAQGYVSPRHMSELLRKILDDQPGLKLVSLTNLPVESLSRAPEPAAAAGAGAVPGAAAAAGKPAIDPTDIGPYLHPVELVVDGDYASIVAYLRVLEGLQWRIHWQQLDLNAQEYPRNRVRIVIGALSLSRDWMSL